MNPEFIIRLIVRARNEIAGVLDKAAGDVDKLTKAQERGERAEKSRAAASRSTGKAIGDVTKRYNDYTAALERGDRSSAQAIKQLTSFRREFDRLGNRVKAGTGEADRLYQLGRAADDLAARIKKANADQVASEVARSRAVQKATADAALARKREADQMVADVRRELDAERQRSVEFNRLLDSGERGYRRRILAIQQGREEVEASAAREVAATNAAAAALEKSDRQRIVRQQELRAEISKTVRAQQAARTDAERALAAARVSRAAEELRGLGVPEREVRRTLKSSFTDQSDDVAITRRQRRINELAAAQRELVQMPTPARGGFLSRFFGSDLEGRVDRINQRLHQFAQSADRSGFSAVKLAGNLRGLVIVGALVFFQQLIGAGVALGGTLVSVASAAIQAGAAIGGALTAGVAQAIPVIGLFAAAWGRVGAVFDAVKQAQKARQTAAFDDAAQADRQRSAADAIRNAQEALANAQRQGVDAQKNLTDARAEAVRQIQDLVAAERQAQLQAESAALAQEDAQAAFRRSLASGNVDQVAGQALQVRQSASDVLSAGVTRGRATFDATRAVRGGVEGMDNVVQARRAVADAARAIVDAQRGLTEANRQAAQTIQQMATGDRLLAQLLGQLSPAERRLFDALERIRARYKRVFTGKGGVLESITDAFTFGVNRANALLGDRGLIQSAKNLADQIGSQLRRIFRFLSGERTRTFITDMADEARKNLPVVTSFLIHVLSLFQNIARAGSPAFRAFLDFLDGLAGKADKATGSDSGLKRLQDFFLRGEKYAESFIKLGLAITQLFLAVIGQSADEGQNSIDSLTKSVQSATAWINSHQKETREFFRQAREATNEVFRAVWALSKAIFSLFHKDQVIAFADAFRVSLLPALVDIAKIVGIVTGLFLKLAGTPVSGEIIRLGLTTFVLFKFFGRLLSLTGRLITVFGTLAASEKAVAFGLKLIQFATGPWGIAIAAIIATIVLLDSKLHFLGDTFKFIKNMISNVFSSVGTGGLAGASLLLITMAGTSGRILTIFTRLAGVVKGITASLVASKLLGGAGGVVGGARGVVSKVLGSTVGRLGVAGLATAGIVGASTHKSEDFGLPQTSSLFGIKSGGLLTKLVGGTSEQAAKFGDTAEQRLKALVKSDNVQGLIALAKQAREVAKDAGGAKDKFLEFASAASSAAREARDALKEAAKPDSLGLAADKLISGKLSWKDFFNGAGFSEENERIVRDLIRSKAQTGKAAEDIGTSFALGLRKGKKPTQETVDSLMETLDSMSPRARTVALNTVVGMTKTLENRKELPAGSAKLIRDAAMKRFIDLKVDSVETARRNVADIASVFRRGAVPVGKAALAMARSVDKVLKKLGVAKPSAGGITFDDGTAVDTGDITASAKAIGGWIGKQGERGRDAVRTLVGRGEVVLNWAQQRAANMAMSGRDSLGGIVNRVRGHHAGGMADSQGYAAGGYVQGALPVTNPATKSLLAQLFKLGYNVTSGLRPGGSTYHGAGSAADFGNSANDLRRLWSVLFPKRAQFAELFGPSGFAGLYHGLSKFQDPKLQADHEDHIHVALLAKLRGVISGAAAGVRKLGRARLDASWTGQRRQLASAALGRVRRIGNRVISRAASSSSSSDGVDHLGALAGVRGSSSVITAFRQAIRAAGATVSERLALFEAGIVESGLRNLSYGDRDSVGVLQQRPSQGWHGLMNPFRAALEFLDHARRLRPWKGSAGQLAQAVQGSAYPDRYDKVRAQAMRYLNLGGPVAGSGSGDTVDAKLTPGEHVWTAREVLRAGGHKVMFALRKMFGGGMQSGGGGYAAGGRVLEIGDSLGVGTEAYLRRALKGITAVNEGGKSSAWAVDILKKQLKDAYTKVILDVGTNDYTAKILAQSLARARKLIGLDRDIILSKIHGGRDVAGKNKVLQDFAAQNANVTIVSPQGRLASDGIHYTPGGYQTRSKSFIDAARADGVAKGAGAYQEPTIHDTSMGGILKELRVAQKIIRGLKSSVISSKFTDALSKTFKSLIGDGGLLDQMKDSITRLSTSLDLRLRQATFNVDKTGRVIKNLDAVGIADRTVENLGTVYKALTDEQRTIESSLKDVNRRLRDPKLSKGAHDYLVGIKRNLTQRLFDVQGEIASNLESMYNAVDQQISARVEQAATSASRGTFMLDFIQRWRDLVGGTLLTAIGAPSNLDMGAARAGALNAQANELQGVLDFSYATGHLENVPELIQKILDLRTSAVEAVKDGLAKDVDEVTRQAARRSSTIDLRGRVATALGRVGDLIQVNVDRINATQATINELASKQQIALANGFYDLAETIGDTMADLQTTIAELSAQFLQDAVDQVNKAAGRRGSQLDLRDRLSNLRQAAGDAAGAFRERAQTLLDRRSSIDFQRQGLVYLLGRAQEQGNTGLAGDLADQIAELDVQLQENTAALKSNTVQARQAMIDQITSRGSFLGGVFSGLQGILNTLGELSGSLDINAIKALMQQQGKTLIETGTGLIGQLKEGFGLDLSGLNPAQIVEQLSKLNFDQLEVGMTVEQQQQFEALINAIIENTGAQLTNTQAVNQLTNPIAQSWSTTAWQLFRNAIFNGSGGLLPQYRFPAMQTGGGVLNDGYAYLHRGETITPAVVTRDTPVQGGDTHLHITSPVEVLDPGYVANVLSFKRSTDRAVS